MKWFFSKTVRQACAMRKHVEKILKHQRDILAPKAVSEVEAAMQEIKTAVASKAGKAALQKQMEKLEQTANKWLKPYPNAAWRENVEVLLVALAVAMAIRTFFLQPFKIPTGSMQPTLYGVTSKDFLPHDGQPGDPDFKTPTGWARVREWFEGISYVHVVADNDGELQAVEPPFRILIFNIKQTLVLGGKSYTIWFPPDYGEQNLQTRAQLQTSAEFGKGRFYHKGEEVVNLRVSAGDHLFVDRLSFNFRSPKRGEVIVFETKGIPEEHRVNPPYWTIPPDQFYIKRLVGLGGERVQIGDDRHLIINGKPLDASTPHFENVYSFDPKVPPRESQYSGHVNLPQTPYSQSLQSQGDGMLVSPDHYLVMGDNTMSSLDSRFWGEFTASSVIGKSFFVYWPVTRRFGRF